MYRWGWYLRSLRDCCSPVCMMFQCCRCFGMVDVSPLSMFRCGWFLRSLRDCRSPAFVRLRQNIRGSMISNVPKHRLCQNINSVKPLTATKYWPCQNINHAILCSSLFLFPRDKSFKLLFVKFHQKIKKVTAKSVFELVCSSGAIACTHVNWTWKLNLMQ